MGNDGNTDKVDFWEYDSGANNWTQKANFTGTVRSNGVGFSIAGKGYYGMGQSLVG